MLFRDQLAVVGERERETTSRSSTRYDWRAEVNQNIHTCTWRSRTAESARLPNPALTSLAGYPARKSWELLERPCRKKGYFNIYKIQYSSTSSNFLFSERISSNFLSFLRLCHSRICITRKCFRKYDILGVFLIINEHYIIRWKRGTSMQICFVTTLCLPDLIWWCCHIHKYSFFLLQLEQFSTQAGGVINAIVPLITKGRHKRGESGNPKITQVGCTRLSAWRGNQPFVVPYVCNKLFFLCKRGCFGAKREASNCAFTNPVNTVRKYLFTFDQKLKNKNSFRFCFKYTFWNVCAFHFLLSKRRWRFLGGAAFSLFIKKWRKVMRWCWKLKVC